MDKDKLIDRLDEDDSLTDSERREIYFAELANEDYDEGGQSWEER